MPELLFIFLEKCFAGVLIHFHRLMVQINNTLKAIKNNDYTNTLKKQTGEIKYFSNSMTFIFFMIHLIKNVPTSSGTEDRTATGLWACQHALLATPLLLCVCEFSRADEGPRSLLFHGLRAVDPQRAHLILRFSQPPAGNDGGFHTALLALAEWRHGAITKVGRRWLEKCQHGRTYILFYFKRVPKQMQQLIFHEARREKVHLKP